MGEGGDEGVPEHCLTNANCNRVNCVVSTHTHTDGTEGKRVCCDSGKIGKIAFANIATVFLSLFISFSDGLVRITADRNEARDDPNY